MAKLNVADLRSEAATRYAALELETEDGRTIVLRNLLRLDDAARKTAQALLGAFAKKASGKGGKGKESTDDLAELDAQERAITDFLLLVADDTEALRDLLADFDLALKMALVEHWTEATQPGEAQRSAS
ncbi:phage tail assembly protein [Kitasatospora indigofera]|uniref:phage tail assembly protein n=1 Tax=Kitasatospora indigofera TaxID=67307 RepID=UPI0036BBC2DA